MGRIVETVDNTMERTVAMKLLLGWKELTDRWQLRFAQEAQITGQLQYPNIIPVYDLGEREDGQLYFTMKRVEGRTFRMSSKGLGRTTQLSSPSTQERSCSRFSKRFVWQSLTPTVVQYRDLKPSNIMIGGYGEVLVMD